MKYKPTNRLVQLAIDELGTIEAKWKIYRINLSLRIISLKIILCFTSSLYSYVIAQGVIKKQSKTLLLTLLVCTWHFSRLSRVTPRYFTCDFQLIFVSPNFGDWSWFTFLFFILRKDSSRFVCIYLYTPFRAPIVN